MSEHEAEVGDEDHNGKVTVKILRRTYDKLKARAISNRYNVVEYTNSLLCHALDKEEFAERYAPNLSLDEIVGNRATLKDTKRRQLIDVYFVDNELRCEADNGSTICIHVKYMWILPQMAKLLKYTGSKDTTNLDRVSLVLPGLMSSIAIALPILVSRFGEVSIF